MFQSSAGVKAGLCLVTAHLDEETASIVLLYSSSKNMSKTSFEARKKDVISRRELLPETQLWVDL